MKFWHHPWSVTGTLMFGVAAGLCGCAHPDAGLFYRQPPPSPPLGTNSDTIWQIQESNAEASKFVVYQHEFKLNSDRLNLGGEDHVKQIAVEVQAGALYPIVIERSMSSPRPDSKYLFPVNQNPELDLRRRHVVVQVLLAMGVQDAEQRVVVAPSFAQGYSAQEAEMSYYRALFQSGGAGSGFGGGGFGGFGGFR